MHNIIQKLESNNSRNFKESVILEQASLKNDNFFEGLKLALDKRITFGVKQVPVHSTIEEGSGLSWDDFVKLTNLLQTRAVTGNAAKDLINESRLKSTAAEWNSWYYRILIKDLKCGVNEKTVNNVVKKKYKDYLVPVVTCQLASDGADHPNKLKGKKILDPKLDGFRTLSIVYPSGQVDQFTRNGKEIFNFEHTKTELNKLSQFIDEPYVFDGEMMSASFQDVMTQIFRKSNVEALDSTLYLFDLLPLNDFEAGICKTKQIDRKIQLSSLLDRISLSAVKSLSYEIVDLDTIAGQQRYKEYNSIALEQKYEGIMKKDLDAPYELKRSTNWLKEKPVLSIDLEVIDAEEGTGKNEGSLGALICTGSDSNGNNIKVNVGGGYSDQLRAQIWANFSNEPVIWTRKNGEAWDSITEYPKSINILGQIIEVHADAVTKNQDGTYSLRFPRFERFRGFEPGEKM